MSEQRCEIPDRIPTVIATEFAAEMTKGWDRQMNRLLVALLACTLLAVTLICLINWGVNYKLARTSAILDSTRQTVAQNREMIDAAREDRIVSQIRFKAVMSTLGNIEKALDRRQRR